MNIWFVSSLGLLGRKILGTFLSFCRYTVSFFLCEYLGVKWLGHVIGVRLTLGEIVELVSTVVVPLCIFTSSE